MCQLCDQIQKLLWISEEQIQIILQKSIPEKKNRNKYKIYSSTKDYVNDSSESYNSLFQKSDLGFQYVLYLLVVGFLFPREKVLVSGAKCANSAKVFSAVF